MDLIKFLSKSQEVFFFLVDRDKFILRFIWEEKDSRITKTKFKTNKVGGINFPNVKVYYIQLGT